MKTTRAQQEQTRRQIVASAVELMARQGFDGTTMKDIARAAGIGDATIYKYFPTKDRIVLGYFDEVARAALADTCATPGLVDYGLHEKLQRLTDAVLERLLPDREFVAEVRTLVRRAPLALLGEPSGARQALAQAVTSFLEAAEASGEIEPCDFKVMAGNLYPDYLSAVMAYWLADESDGFADTTQLVDLSLGVLVLTLRAGLVNRVLQLGGFLLRSQMARLLQHGSGLLGMLQLARQTMEGEAGRAAARRRAGPAAAAASAFAAPEAEAEAGTRPARAPRKPRARKAAP